MKIVAIREGAGARNRKKFIGSRYVPFRSLGDHEIRFRHQFPVALRHLSEVGEKVMVRDEYRF